MSKNSITAFDFDFRDVDDDSEKEIVVANNSNKVLVFDPNLNLKESFDYGPSTTVRLVDTDGDSIPEIVVARWQSGNDWVIYKWKGRSFIRIFQSPSYEGFVHQIRSRNRE